MSHLYLWADVSHLPVKVLATIGGFAVGGFLGGWVFALMAKAAFNQKVPNGLAWIIRLVSGGIFAWFVWITLAGSGPFGGLGDSLFGNGPGGNTTTKDKDTKSDKDGKDDKKTDPGVPPKEKDPKNKIETDGPGIGVGETLRVEVLGNGPLEKLAGERKMNLEKRYRIADAPTTLRTFEEIKKLILERRSQTPPLKKLDVVIYLDSPDRASSPVKGLVDWAQDLDPGVAGALVVEEKTPTRSAPLK
jgi:hypothetical protein